MPSHFTCELDGAFGIATAGEAQNFNGAATRQHKEVPALVSCNVDKAGGAGRYGRSFDQPSLRTNCQTRVRI